MSGFERDSLHRKPYDDRPGNEQFYLQLYAVMSQLVKPFGIVGTDGGAIMDGETRVPPQKEQVDALFRNELAPMNSKNARTYYALALANY